VATPNYGFEKRQRELAKKKKKEEKLKAKAERKSGVDSPETEGSADGDEEAGGQPTQEPQAPV